MATLDDVLADVMSEHPDGIAVPALMREVRARGGHGVSRKAVERSLEQRPQFIEVAEAPGRGVAWGMTDHEPEPPAAPVDTARPLDGLDLRNWQIDAFAAWASASCQGVVEAITGSGKTRLAIAAARAALSRNGRVLVLAPTLDLLSQWRKELRTHIPNARVGQLGGGQDGDLFDHDIVIATPNSAARVPLDLPPGTIGCLIADEAHRYGSPLWGRALHDTFQMRLALTATYERGDDGIDDVLAPYFGGVVYSYSYSDAARDGVIAPFRVAFVATALDPSEQQDYNEFDRRAKSCRNQLTAMQFPQDPKELVARAAAVVAEADRSGKDSRSSRLCREYLSTIRKRRDVAASAAGKLTVTKAVAAPLHEASRSLVFCDTVDQCHLVEKLLRQQGLAAETLHGNLGDTKRRIRMAQFRNGNIQTLIAPRVLDEGVDLPEADVALVLAAFRSRRQMVQRLGRILRVKADGRAARLMVVFATGTNEDPSKGAHAAFRADVLPVAQDVTHIDMDRDEHAAAAWLSNREVRS